MYNKDELREKYWIPLRLAIGDVRHFYSNPSSKGGPVYAQLESSAMSFLHRFYRIFDPAVLFPVAPFAGASPSFPSSSASVPVMNSATRQGLSILSLFFLSV